MRINLKTVIFSLVVCAGMLSCTGKSSNSGVSPLTGDKYNDIKGTGFEVKESYKTMVPPGMVAIQGGTFEMGQRGESITAQRDNPLRKVTVQSFFMDQYEVRNVDWREYSHWMKLVYGKVAPDLVERVKPDGSVWRDELAYNDPIIANYYTSPAYNDYPIVGITWEQAMEFCGWRTDRVNEQALIKANIIERPNYAALESMSIDSIRSGFVFNTQKYLLQSSYNPTSGKSAKKDLNNNTRKVDMSDGILFPDFRLPTEAEWEFAAYAPVAGKDGILVEGKIYPWGGNQTRNTSSKKDMGKMQANFVRGRGDMMGTAGDLNDNATITTKVTAYYPNDFGLYNMAGNVNEWVLDVYRSTSSTTMTEYNPVRGNIYMKPVIASKNETGHPTYELDAYGNIKMEVEFDARNYKDGDAQSQISFTLADSIPLMNDSIDNVLRPIISEKTRVYKGGSWKDRIYWLNPSTRRYMDQDKCSNDIGFRCAMSMIGDDVAKKKR